jgi:hypothetical protein
VKPERLVASFLNPLTALSAELEGRHYGGGVLELVPSEIEKLLIPLKKSARYNLAKVDELIRTQPTEQVFKKHGSVILKSLGLTTSEVDRLTSGWDKLRNRRQRTTAEASL